MRRIVILAVIAVGFCVLFTTVAAVMTATSKVADPTLPNPNNFTATILGLQFAAFGWRLVREVGVGDKGTDAKQSPEGSAKTPTAEDYWKQWVPLPDILNLMSIWAVLINCIAVPIVGGVYSHASMAVLVAAAVLMAFHPISLACHYELFRGGRGKVQPIRREWKYVTSSEGICVLASILVAGMAGAWSFVYAHGVLGG